MNREFKEELFRIKSEYGLTQGEIADELGVNRAYLSTVGNGRDPYTDSLRKKIEEKFPKRNTTNVAQQNVEYHYDSSEKWLPIIEKMTEQNSALIEQNKLLLELLNKK